MKKIIIVIAAVALAGFGGYFGYQHWKMTPSNAISQLRASVQNHDLALFNEYVDLQSVLDRGADNLLASKGRQNWASDIARGIAISLKPKLVKELTAGIESWIGTGKVPSDGAGPAAVAARAVVSQVGQLLFLDIVEVKEAKRARIVTVKVRHQVYGCELEPELLMLETDKGHLQLAEVTNLSDLLAQLLVGELAWKSSQNEEARKKMREVLEVSGLAKSTKEGLLGLGRKIIFSANASNESDQTITRIEATLTATALEDKRGRGVTKKWPVTFETAIAPGKTEPMSWEFSVNPFVAEEMAIYKAATGSLSLTLEIESIELAGGQRLKIPYPE